MKSECFQGRVLDEAIDTISRSTEKTELIEELLESAKGEQVTDRLLKERLGSEYKETIHILLSNVHVISERLNVFEGKGRDLSDAVRRREKETVQKAILDQVRKGADSIDIQLDGLGVTKGAEEKFDLTEVIGSMEWTIEILSTWEKSCFDIYRFYSW